MVGAIGRHHLVLLISTFYVFISSSATFSIVQYTCNDASRQTMGTMRAIEGRLHNRTVDSATGLAFLGFSAKIEMQKAQCLLLLFRRNPAVMDICKLDFRFARLSWLCGVLCAALIFGLTPSAVMAQPTDSTYAGAYKAWVRSPEGRPIDSTLYLNIDGTVLLIDDRLFGEAPMTRTGQWSSTENAILLTFTSDPSGLLPQPLSVTLDTFVGQPLIMRSDEASQELAGRRYYTVSYLFENRNTLPYSAEVAAATIASSGLAGAYKAFAPDRAGGRRDLTLMLFPDFRVILKRDTVDGRTPSMTYGAWQDIGGQVFVTLTEADGVSFRTPVEITFGVESGILRGLTTASANAADLVGVPFYRLEGLANAVTVLLPPEAIAPPDEGSEAPAVGSSMPEEPPPLDPAAIFPETPTGLAPSSTEIVAEYEPSFAETPCPADLLVDSAITCGFLTVPENRSRSDSQPIRLFVVKLAAQGDALSDPLVVLAGAPGDDPSRGVQWFSTAPVRKMRHILILHPRGDGLSSPSLACPEYVADGDPQIMLQSLADCYNRLLQEGRDLTGYSLDQRAVDVADLARALGFEQINLLGNDIGAAVVQLAAERFPSIVRSVVLESPAPLGVNRTLEGAFGAFDALREVFDDCAHNTACATAYPDLETRFLQLIDWYNQNPTPESIGFGDGDAIARLVFAKMRQGGRDIPALIHALYMGDFGAACQIAPVVGGCLLPASGVPSPGVAAPSLPEQQGALPVPPGAKSGQTWRDYFIDPDNPEGVEVATLDRLQMELGIDTRAGLIDFLDSLPHQNFLPLLAATTGVQTAPAPSTATLAGHGAHLNVVCAEDAPRYTIDDVQRVARRLPLQVAPLLIAPAEKLLIVCELWLTPPAASGDRVIQVSTAPALIMAGGHDPVTPARWARRGATDFNQPFVRIFAGEGHHLLQTPDSCAQQMMAAFIDHPDRAPDAFCFRSQRPTFLLPTTLGESNPPSELVGRSRSE
jgi:pimeloyl-ACP methyl ester carboxylesterase